jgi:O-antigen/teichoic acid export membrane protein
LFYHKQATNKIFIATITGSFADILLASIFVKMYGMYGAALSFVVAKLIVVSIVVQMSKGYNNVGYRVIDMARIIVPSLIFMGAGLYFSYTKYLVVISWCNLIYKFAVLFVYLGFMYLRRRVTGHSRTLACSPFRHKCNVLALRI